MNFQKAIAELVGPSVIPKPIEFNGVTKTFYFRRISGLQADELLQSILTEDNKVDQVKTVGSAGREVAASICDEDGNPVASADEINALPGPLRAKLAAAVKEVNGLGEKKPSAAESDSGSSSPQSSDTPSST